MHNQDKSLIISKQSVQDEGSDRILTPNEAFILLDTDITAVLVDVRTNAERDWVGRVSIRKTQHAAIQWLQYPSGARNPDFLTNLSEVAEKETTLIFLCRSGIRSKSASELAIKNGYKICFNILEGFEGSKDSDGHRKNINGWCKSGLPWIGS